MHLFDERTCAQTIDKIMKSDTSQLSGRKCILPASITIIDMDSDRTSASEHDYSF